jgi:hypothetical protein
MPLLKYTISVCMEKESLKFAQIWLRNCYFSACANDLWLSHIHVLPFSWWNVVADCIHCFVIICLFWIILLVCVWKKNHRNWPRFGWEILLFLCAQMICDCHIFVPSLLADGMLLLTESIVVLFSIIYICKCQSQVTRRWSISQSRVRTRWRAPIVECQGPLDWNRWALYQWRGHQYCKGIFTRVLESSCGKQ